MDIYDKQQVQAIWDRVLAGRKPEETYESDLTPGILRERIENAQMDSMVYSRMYRMYPRYGTVFRRLAAEELRHGKQLEALHLLLFGKNSGAVPGAVRVGRPFLSALREQFVKELSDARHYAQLARQFPDHGVLFLRMSKEESAHAESLRRIAQQQAPGSVHPR